MSQITPLQTAMKIAERSNELSNKGADAYTLIAELQLKVEALEKETGESNEEAFEKWRKTDEYKELSAAWSVSQLTVGEFIKAAWLASRKRK